MSQVFKLDFWKNFSKTTSYHQSVPNFHLEPIEQGLDRILRRLPESYHCGFLSQLQLYFWLGKAFPTGTDLKTEKRVYDLKKLEEWILKDETFPMYIEAVQNTLEDILKT